MEPSNNTQFNILETPKSTSYKFSVFKGKSQAVLKRFELQCFLLNYTCTRTCDTQTRVIFAYFSSCIKKFCQSSSRPHIPHHFKWPSSIFQVAENVCHEIIRDSFHRKIRKSEGGIFSTVV